MMKSIALKNYSFFFPKLSLTGLVVLLLMLFTASQAQAYEAHVVGATATIESCDGSSPHCLQVDSCLKINEVYYDVDEVEKGLEGKNEWVEIYNTCDTDIRLQDWTLTNGAGRVETITTNRPVGAYEFWVISHDNQTCGNLWSCDPNQHINLGNYPFKEWLNDEGDHIVLKDSLGLEIDAVSWGTDTSAFDPSVPDVEQGHSIARVEKGVDTDKAADWEDLAEPNPGTNPHIESFQTLAAEVVPGIAPAALTCPELLVNPEEEGTGETTDSAATLSSENAERTNTENSDTPEDEATGEATDSAAISGAENAAGVDAVTEAQNPTEEQENPAAEEGAEQDAVDPAQTEDQDSNNENPAALESTENQESPENPDAAAQEEQSSDDQNQDEAIKKDDEAIIKEDDNGDGGDAGNNPADTPSDAPPPDSPDNPTDQV